MRTAAMVAHVANSRRIGDTIFGGQPRRLFGMVGQPLRELLLFDQKPGS
jgi:hypothetical protein